MYSEPNQAFGYAVLASIVLHGMLLFAVAQPRPRVALVEPEFPPIVARLVEPEPPAPPAAAAPQVIPPEVKPPAVEPPKPKAAPRPKAKAPKPVAKPLPKPAPPAVAEVPAAPEPAPPPPVIAPPPPMIAPPPIIARTDPAPSEPAVAVPSAPALPAPAPAGVKTVPDSVMLAQYRSELLNVARKYKRYPRVAMENNWEGHVVVRLVVGVNGSVAGLSVQSSSGHKLLDQQALEMFRKAATAVQVPPALHGREFTLEVRAIYNLTDQDSG